MYNIAKQPGTLYTMSDIGKALGISKQAVDGLYKRDRIETPDWITTSGVNGWTEEQFKRIVKTHEQRRKSKV